MPIGGKDSRIKNEIGKMNQPKDKRQSPQQKVINYFNSWESRWGYTLLLKGTKHFGYYPKGKENLSIAQAQKLMEDKLAERLNLKANSLVLDAGCGEGGVAIYLAQKYGLRVKGVDLMESAIKKAREKAADFGLQRRVDFQVMDYTKLSFANESFDGVYTMESLVHVPDHQQALYQFFRVLKPKGRLALFEYSICPKKEMTLQQQKFWSMLIESWAMPSLPYFLHGSFPQILERIGFTDVSVKNITLRMIPMVRRLSQIAYLPYQMIKLLNLQRKFINATFAVEGYRNITKSDIWRYNIISAVKSK